MENIDVNAKNWKSLIKPTKLDISSSEDKSQAKIVAEPVSYTHLTLPTKA